MNMTNKLTLVIIGLLFPMSANYAKTLDWTDKPVFAVIGVVDRSIIAEAARLLVEGSKHKEINILVNSPGGMVDTGLIYIQAMKQLQKRGIKINCVSGVLAASMGFQILTHCDRVYALPNALLLFHPVSIQGMMRLTASDMAYLYNQITKIETVMNDNLQKKFKFNPSYFDYHYKRETLHQAHELASRTRAITLVKDVKGIESILYKHSRPRSFFNWGNLSNHIIYIKKTTLQLLKGRK